MTGGGRKPTREELRLWRDAMGGRDGVAPDEPPRPEESEAPGPASKTAPPAPVPPAPVPGGIDKHTARAIRRGKLPVEDRIDLHGMTQAEAHRAVTTFLQDRAAQGMKCVLVITGKGGRVTGDDGSRFTGRTSVLRVEFPGWLEGPDLAPIVIGSEPALPKDGGSGARYVLLRRA